MYQGQRIRIPLGQAGLRTDDNPSEILPPSLIEALNVEIRKGFIEKQRGSRRWNSSALPDGIAALLDWWPTEVRQRFIAVLNDGRIFKLKDSISQTEITAATGSTETLTGNPQTHVVVAGAESQNRDRKIFVFTGNNPVQVIAGDATVRSDISGPVTDWDESYPSYGLLHRNRLLAFGNQSSPHTIYVSSADDHEDFNTNPILIQVDPGEGERIESAFVFKGRVFIFKRPQGVWFLDDTQSADPELWFPRKLTDEFGIASPHSTVQMLDDLVAKNFSGSITSLRATERFGDVEAGDVLALAKVEEFVRDLTTPLGNSRTQAVYFPERKRGMFTYRRTDSTEQNITLNIDISRQTPNIHISDKDQINCFSLRKVLENVQVPYYGSNDGYIYEMEREDRNVAGNSYLMDFQTPHMDFGFADPNVSEKNKLFDFLEVTYIPTGNADLDVEVSIDGKRGQTLNFPLRGGDELDTTLITDSGRLGGEAAKSLRRRLCGSGRRISFRCTNNGLNENPQIIALTVYFRLSNEDNRD